MWKQCFLLQEVLSSSIASLVFCYRAGKHNNLIHEINLITIKCLCLQQLVIHKHCKTIFLDHNFHHVWPNKEAKFYPLPGREDLKLKNHLHLSLSDEDKKLWKENKSKAIILQKNNNLWVNKLKDNKVFTETYSCDGKFLGCCIFGKDSRPLAWPGFKEVILVVQLVKFSRLKKRTTIQQGSHFTLLEAGHLCFAKQQKNVWRNNGLSWMHCAWYDVTTW